MQRGGDGQGQWTMLEEGIVFDKFNKKKRAQRLLSMLSPYREFQVCLQEKATAHTYVKFEFKIPTKSASMGGISQLFCVNKPLILWSKNNELGMLSLHKIE